MKIKLPKRKADTHKGDYGKVLIVAGSPGMTGAAVLASRGALRSGAGLVYLSVPKELVNFVDTITPEVITLSFDQIKDIKPDAVAIGPGLGTSDRARNALSSVVSRPSSVIIDADAINILAKNPNLLEKSKANLILTPHPGEMGRLIGKSVQYVQANRIKVAKDAAKKFNCIVVLKGNKTVVASPSGKNYVNSTGNPGMAKGGMGDVLTGMIAGLSGQGISPWDAAVAGVYLHGLAGDLAAKEKGEYSMTASDLIDKVPNAIQQLH